jgi:acyl-CoA hydrolase
MINHKLVLPQYLNHYGFLFGGHLLKWVDEYAYIAASMEYPSCDFVTIGMDKVEFRKSVTEGTILIFMIDKTREGKTSVQFSVSVFSTKAKAEKDMIFSTKVTFVRIDKEGEKRPLPR